MPLPSQFIPPCIPTRAPKPPAGADWVHEIKHDGYRLQVRREGDAVRLFTRRGYDWTTRYPALAANAAKLRAGWPGCHPAAGHKRPLFETGLTSSRRSSAASASNHFRNVSIFGVVDVALGQTTQ